MTAGNVRPTRLADREEIDAFLENRSIALVEFYTAGCPMCDAMEPVLGTVARRAEGFQGAGDVIDFLESNAPGAVETTD